MNVQYWARICKSLSSLLIDSKESILPVYVAWRAGMTIDDPTVFDAPVTPGPATKAGGIDSLESIPGFLGRLKIRALYWTCSYEILAWINDLM